MFILSASSIDDSIAVIAGLLIFITVMLAVLIHKENNIKKREATIESIESILFKKGLTITKKIVDINENHSIFVDNKNKKLIFYNFETNSYRIVKYSEIVSFELLEDDNTVMSGRVGSAIVGGLLFGGLGAIAGASGPRKISEKSCNSMVLNIVINNMDSPNIEIEFIDTLTKKDTDEYEEAVEQAQEVITILKIILENNKNQSKINSTQEPKTNSVQELREYKQLLDDGIITEEEFNLKKKEILNIK